MKKHVTKKNVRKQNRNRKPIKKYSNRASISNIAIGEYPQTAGPEGMGNVAIGGPGEPMGETEQWGLYGPWGPWGGWYGPWGGPWGGWYGPWGW